MIDFSNVEAVIFDFDGTLYCKKGFVKKLILSAPVYLFRMKADRTVRHELKGMYFDSGKEYFGEYIKRFSKKTKLSPQKSEKWYKEFYLPRLAVILKKYFSPFAEVEQIFKALSEKGIKTAVFSDYGYVTQRMDALKIDYSMVGVVTSAEELGGLKPCKEPFYKIAEKLGVTPEKVLVVGDRLDTDGEGAKNAGMQFAQISSETPLATYFSQFLPC